MKKPFIIVLAILTSYFAANSQGTHLTPSYSVTLDSSKGPQLLRQCSRSVPRHIKAYWTPKREDIQNLESSLNKLSGIIARECCVLGARVDSLHQLGFQYLGVTIKGRKYIYINAFPPNTIADYKRLNLDPAVTPVVVCDGGTR